MQCGVGSVGVWNGSKDRLGSVRYDEVVFGYHRLATVEYRMVEHGRERAERPVWTGKSWLGATMCAKLRSCKICKCEVRFIDGWISVQPFFIQRAHLSFAVVSLHFQQAPALYELPHASILVL